MSEHKGICVIAEITADSKLAGVTLELINKACELSKKLDNQEVSVLLITGMVFINETIDQLSKAGADNVWLVQADDFKEYSTDLYAKAACDVIKQKKPAIVIVGATTMGRDLAPRISSKLDTGLTADCTGLDINEKGQLAATRPTFGGNLMATILCKNFPQMASVRPKVMPKPQGDSGKTANVEKFNIYTKSTPKRVELLEFIQTVQNETARIDEAQIIVAGGKGLKNAENFKLIENLANALGGAVGATRAAVDAGWRTHCEQIGQTGKTVTPKLYIACGISGAIQHLAGMNSSDVIIAINKDPKAPIFSVATYGIVGDLFEIVPALTEAIKEQK